ncbi:MAG: DUF2961 domain-containing protein [Pirellulales bacterium]|nr:DUF2961 domain-containing protein [Pirellulales bacterium]
MIPHVKTLAVACLLLSPTLAAAEALSDLAGPIEGRRMRASSTGPRETNRDHAVIPPGETITLAELTGPGEILHIWFTVATAEFRYPAKTILRIYWDDSAEPSVQAPLGDFFAVGNGMRTTVNSTPVQVSAEGRAYNCYWPMPFARKARITVENQSDKTMGALYYYIDWQKFDKPRPDALYFHAQYRQERPHDPAHDYTILETRGRGHYVGTVLSSHNAYHAWFGEGNDRVFIDGEETPSLTGTGTEDYFNDAWGFRPFNHPDAGCTVFEGRSVDSRVSAYRWHIADPITFTTSLRFTIENKGWVFREDGKAMLRFQDRRDNYSSVAFWYQDKPAADVPPIPPLAQRVDPEIFFDNQGLLELAKTSGDAKAGTQFNRPSLGRRFFRVRAAGPGAAVTFPVSVKQKGRYSISIWKVDMPDGGTWRAVLDGKTIVPRLDFHGPGTSFEENGEMDVVRPVTERKLGLFYLDPGTHELRFECTGRNPQSHVAGGDAPAFNLGLDAMSLRKIAFENMDRYLPDQP